MDSQNSFYYFVIWFIKCNGFDTYEKTDIWKDRKSFCVL